MSITRSVHRVYWTNEFGPQSEDFHDLGLALKEVERLRTWYGRFVVIASEQIECVSLRGVASPSPDYNWKKRRL